jgi:hypothetical protein
MVPNRIPQVRTSNDANVMSTICLIRPNGYPPDIQCYFNSWAAIHNFPAITAPSHSLTSDYSGFYAGPPPSNLAADVKASNVVIFYGHGDWDRLIIRNTAGPPSNWACSSPVPPALDASHFAGKFLVAVACKAGYTLGPALMAVGATGFLGFNDSVAYIATPGLASTHFENAFVRGPNALLNRLASGRSHADAGSDARQAWRGAFFAAHDHFKYDTTAAAHPNALEARVWALWNANQIIAL